jgi:hypothetical protein
VAGIIENVYSKFKLMLIKRDEASKNSLVAQLTRINDHMEATGSRFLTGQPSSDHMEATGSRFLTGQITACRMARQAGWSETSVVDPDP